MILPSRRRFLFGATALLAAPSIVRVASLMPVSVIESTLILQPGDIVHWNGTSFVVRCVNAALTALGESRLRALDDPRAWRLQERINWQWAPEA